MIAAAFVTSFYSFRLLALVFGGIPRMSDEAHAHAKDCDWTISVPLVVLAVPSVLAGWFLFEPMVFGDWLAATRTAAGDEVMGAIMATTPGPWALVKHAVVTPIFWAALAGILVASYMYLFSPGMADGIAAASGPLHRVLLAKYGLDDLNQAVFAGGARKLGGVLWRVVDTRLVDGAVNGGAALVARGARLLRVVQSGRIYHYAFVMIVSLLALAAWRLTWA